MRPRRRGLSARKILAPADALRVEVAGLGAVQAPVRGPLAKKLIAVGRPAKFGRAEQTLTDTSMRDTWEITPDLVALDGPVWEATLGVVLDDVRDERGLPPTTTLRAELHAMLIYGKGQFFLPHQDSEKDNAMVGTLVVSLPSAHTGGDLIVEHGGESVTYRTSKRDLSFVAFYADCRHEVKPVTSGYRMTLTFNLLADGRAGAQGSGPAADLARCLADHFATPATPRYGRADLDPPSRLVEIASRPRGVICHGQGSASDEEEFGSRPACLQFRRQVIEERADVLPPEAGAHTRSSAPVVMKMPRRRNEDGDSTRARGWRPRRSVTNHHGHASRPGSRAHDGTSHPSRRARYSAIAANAASTLTSPVLLGALVHIRAAAGTPAWRRALV